MRRLLFSIIFATPLVVSILVARDPTDRFKLEATASADRTVLAVAGPETTIEDVTISITYAAARTIVTGRGGRVTSLPETWPRRDGSVVVEIDGRPIYLQSDATPLYRLLSPEVVGADVADLVALLEAAGFLLSGEAIVDRDNPSATRYSATIAGATRAMSRTTALEPTSTFDPSWTVWTRDPSLDARAIVEIGDTVEVGDPLYEIMPRAIDLTVTNRSSAAEIADGEVRLMAQDLPELITIAYPPGKADLDRVSETLPNVATGTDGNVVVTLEAVAERVRPASDRGSLLPVTAVVADLFGGYCVRSSDTEKQWIAVDILIEVAPGVLLVRGIEPGRSVFAAPAESVTRGFSCP